MLSQATDWKNYAVLRQSDSNLPAPTENTLLDARAILIPSQYQQR